MWLLYSYYTVVYSTITTCVQVLVVSVGTKTIKTFTYGYIKAECSLLLLFRRKKIKRFFLMLPKAPLVACVFYFVLMCTSFWFRVTNCFSCICPLYCVILGDALALSLIHI